MTENRYEIPAQIRDLSGKSIEEAAQGLRKFHRGLSKGNRSGGRHCKRPAIERQGGQREGAQRGTASKGNRKGYSFQAFQAFQAPWTTLSPLKF